MSDVVVPLTSPVHLTNIEDIHAVDLHVRYCELVKAYEHLVSTLGPTADLCNSSTPRPFDCFHGQVRDKNQEKKSYEQQVSAMRDVMAKETVHKRV